MRRWRPDGQVIGLAAPICCRSGRETGTAWIAASTASPIRGDRARRTTRLGGWRVPRQEWPAGSAVPSPTTRVPRAPGRSASILHSNGDGLDIGVKDGRIVGVRGRAEDRVNHGRVDPYGLLSAR